MQTEKIINTAYSFGAAVVVFGAWAKIEHKVFADTALTVGLLVETTIFLIYGVMEWRKDTVDTAEGTPVIKAKEPVQKEAPPTRQLDGVMVEELTTTMKKTNQILNKVFKAD